jgi:hypothetical protein
MRGNDSVVRKHAVITLLIALHATFALIIPAPRPLAADLYEHVSLDNGIEAAVCTPDMILAHLAERDETGRLIFHVPDGGSFLFVEDTSDPSIVNKGDGAFHPMRMDMVLEALSEIDVRGRRIDCAIVLYILPYPRAGYLRSTASGNDIFLCPGVYEPNAAFTAYVVTHEFGHVFQHRHAPRGEDEWERYLRVRGLYGDPRYADDAEHKNRPGEIFAEDFRYLFGGAAACYTGLIENPDILLPDQVSGLEEYFVSLLSPVVASSPGDGGVPPGRIVSAANYPNPFNPSTTIEVAFEDAGGGGTRGVAFSIYRIDGSLVRTLYSGELSGTVLRTTWDGLENDGSPAPSGVYFYRVRSGNETATGKMLLVR